MRHPSSRLSIAALAGLLLFGAGCPSSEPETPAPVLPDTAAPQITASPESLELAGAFLNQGVRLYTIGRDEDIARGLLDRAYGTFLRQGSTADAVAVLQNLATIFLQRGMRDSVIEVLELALRVDEEAARRYGIHVKLERLKGDSTVILAEVRDLEARLADLGDVRTVQARVFEAYTLRDLGYLSLELDNLEGSRQYFRRSRAALEAILPALDTDADARKYGLDASARYVLGQICVMLRDLPAARQYVAAAAEMFRSHDMTKEADEADAYLKALSAE